MHKKSYKNATNDISTDEKKRFSGIFKLEKLRVVRLTPGIDSLINFTSMIYF